MNDNLQSRMAELYELRQTLDEHRRRETALHHEVDELRRSNAELDSFATMIAHDLKAPLLTLNGFVQIIAQRSGPQLDTESVEYLRYAADAAKRMHEMIHGLLEYSRADVCPHGLLALALPPLLDEACANLHAALEGGAAAVETDALPTVMGDSAQLVRLFQNLIDNALKYRRPDVPPRLRIDAVPLGEHWRIGVHDNGIGFDMAHAQKIFNIFHRLNGADEYPGTGVGLAVCKKIVQRHGGWIWAESNPGQGASFYFTLQSNAAAGSSHSAASSRGGGGVNAKTSGAGHGGVGWNRPSDSAEIS